MAARVAGSSSAVIGYAIAITVISLLMVVGWGLGIYWYTQTDEALASARENEQLLAQFADSKQRGNREVSRLMQEEETVVGALLKDREDFRLLITGSPDTEYKNIRTEMLLIPKDRIEPEGADGEFEVKTILPTDTVFGVFKEMYDKLTAEQNEKLTAMKERDELLDQLAAKNTELSQQSENYNERIDTLGEEIKQLNGQIQRLQNEIVDKTKSYGNQVGELQALHNEQLAKVRAEAAEWESKYREQLAENSKLLQKQGVPKLLSDEHEPDGRILAVVEGENMVHIDLGRQHNVLLGMTFEVYDQRTGTPHSLDHRVDNTYRGKATIEVIKVDEVKSLCQIVRRTPRTMIRRDDVIVNAVYDRYRQYTFFVFGQFDIDNTGATSETDIRRVEAMIREWNGQVAAQRGPEVDFVVLGDPPPVPKKVTRTDASGTTPDFAQERIYEVQKRRYEAYVEVVEWAQANDKPILTSNRFLTLVGYYQR